VYTFDGTTPEPTLGQINKEAGAGGDNTEDVKSVAHKWVSKDTLFDVVDEQPCDDCQFSVGIISCIARIGGEAEAVESHPTAVVESRGDVCGGQESECCAKERNQYSIGDDREADADMVPESVSFRLLLWPISSTHRESFVDWLASHRRAKDRIKGVKATRSVSLNIRHGEREGRMEEDEEPPPLSPPMLAAGFDAELHSCIHEEAGMFITIFVFIHPLSTRGHFASYSRDNNSMRITQHWHLEAACGGRGEAQPGCLYLRVAEAPVLVRAQRGEGLQDDHPVRHDHECCLHSERRFIHALRHRDIYPIQATVVFFRSPVCRQVRHKAGRASSMEIL